jgi:hypothetical protein
MAAKLNTTEARQGSNRPRMVYVLGISLVLAVIAGLALAAGWISIPWGS